MLKIPPALLPYVDFENGKLIATDLPEELKDSFAKLQKTYKAIKEDEYTDY